MKKLTLMIAFFTAPLLFVCGQTPDDMMREANKLYQDGQYEAAVQSYEKILSSGYESGALYFNLGNAYFKSGKLGFAVYNYERGLKIQPTDEDLAYNLKLANARSVDKITEVPKIFFVAWWEGLITSLSVSGWSLIVLAFYLILIVCIGVYLLVRNSTLQRIAFMGGSASLSVLLLAAFFLFARINREASTNYGVLLSQSYTVKISPDLKSSDAFVIHEGIKFVIEDHVGEWSKIRLVDGKVGWVQKDSFGQI
jgi:tetratricopeptide (TPR) repeat protein